MAEEEVGLRLSLKDRRQTVAGLDDVGDKLDRVGDEADQAGRKARIAAGGLLTFGRSGKLAGRAVVYGFGAATAGVVGAGIALTKLSKDSIAEAREAQKVGAITRREIKATGKAANITAGQVGRLTGAISEKVGVDDEEIQAGANMILTFKNVRNEAGKGSKIFNRATQAAVDLAKAGFGSITSQSKVLAKALNDPVKGLSALGRSGVTFTQDQQDRIKYLAEHNDLLGAQKIMLAEVQSQVGGVAEAQATWGEKASVSIGNIKESIGTALLPTLDRAEQWFVQKGAPVLEDWVGIFERRGIPTIERYAGLFADKAVPAIGDFLDDARPLANSVLPAIGTGLETAADAFKVIAPRAKSVFDAFNDLPDWAKTGIALGALGGVAAKKLGAFDKGSLLGSIATKATPLPVYVVNGMPGTGVPVGAPGGGGRPGVPPVIPGALRNPIKGIPGGVWGLGALMATVTLASRDGVIDADKPQMDWDVYLKQRKEAQIKAARETAAALDQLLVKPLGRGIEGLNDQFDVLGAKRPTPKVAAPGLDSTLLGGDRLIGILGQLDRTTARPRVEVDVSGAYAAIDSVRDAFNNVLGSFGGGGSGVSSGGSRHDWGDLKAPKPPKRGRVTANMPTAPKMPTFDDGWAAAGAERPLHVHLNVDGREVTSVVLDRVRELEARG